jgi:uracil phosphoribosyltransferase
VARGVIIGDIVTSADGYRTMFYVGAIDERLNDKGYIVPGYANLCLTH